MSLKPLKTNWVDLSSPATKLQVHEIWQDYGILVVSRESLPNVYRDMVDVLGTFLYGSKDS